MHHTRAGLGSGVRCTAAELALHARPNYEAALRTACMTHHTQLHCPQGLPRLQRDRQWEGDVPPQPVPQATLALQARMHDSTVKIFASVLQLAHAALMAPCHLCGGVCC